MNLHALYHKSQSNYSYCYDKKKIHIRLRAAKGDLDQVSLIYGDKYEWHKKQSLVMDRICSDRLYDYFVAEVEPEHKRLAYIFEIVKGAEKLFFTEWGASEVVNDNELYLQFFQYPYMHETDLHITPQWVRDAVFYQIFPERFYNGNPDINPENLSPWGSKVTSSSFFGGDLKGIIEKLDYLEDLGINALYLTPIFESPTNHKYDTTDYFKIDPNFGDLDTLKELVEKCHQKGIRVLLDAVFNHSGYFFKPFQDVIKRGPESPYYDWFHIYKWPLETDRPSYDTFAFVSNMPKLNTQNPEVKEYLLKAAKYWIEEADIDGWRLDVADEVDHEFWRDFRKTVKAMKPDAYIIGENWLDNFPWLRGDQFDAVMNYPFTRSCTQYFAADKITENEFKSNLNIVQMNNTQQVNEIMFNLLDSHDTVRFLTLSGGDKNKLKLASIMQFTYVGAPCIYYGTEIGMEGAGDPDCRRTMNWDENSWDKELQNHYKSLIRLRKKSEALRRGSFRWLEADNDLLAFERKTENEKIIVIINNHAAEKSFRLDLGRHKAFDAMTDEPLTLDKKDAAISLNKHSARIILLRES